MYKKKIFFIPIFLFVLIFTHKASAQADCPDSDGLIDYDTTWGEEITNEGTIDCSQKDLIIDGSVLTIVVNEERSLEDILNVRNITFKNNGDIKVEVKVVQKKTNRIIETVTEVSAVTDIAAKGVVAVQAISYFSLLASLRFNIFALVTFISRVIFQKGNLKDTWGVVYDSGTRKPIPFAIVNLYDVNGQALVKTTVTDLEGRYGFAVGKGEYFIKVRHDEYRFKAVEEVKNSIYKNNTYSGESFQIEEDMAINFDIPLKSKHTSNVFGMKQIFYKIKKLFISASSKLLLFIFFLNLLLLIVNFNTLNFIFVVIYALGWLAKQINNLKRPKSWGIIYNSNTKIPVPYAFVKLFQSDKNELVDTKVTDNQGKYQFFVDNDDYLLLVAAPGYKFPSVQMNQEERVFYGGLLKVDIENKVLNKDIPVDPVPGGSTSPFS